MPATCHSPVLLTSLPELALIFTPIIDTSLVPAVDKEQRDTGALAMGVGGEGVTQVTESQAQGMSSSVSC